MPHFSQGMNVTRDTDSCILCVLNNDIISGISSRLRRKRTTQWSKFHFFFCKSRFWCVGKERRDAEVHQSRAQHQQIHAQEALPSTGVGPVSYSRSKVSTVINQRPSGLLLQKNCVELLFSSSLKYLHC